MNHFTPFLPAGAVSPATELPEARKRGAEEVAEIMIRMHVETQKRIEFALLAILAVVLPLVIAAQVSP